MPAGLANFKFSWGAQAFFALSDVVALLNYCQRLAEAHEKRDERERRESGTGFKKGHGRSGETTSQNCKAIPPSSRYFAVTASCTIS